MRAVQGHGKFGRPLILAPPCRVIDGRMRDLAGTFNVLLEFFQSPVEKEGALEIGNLGNCKREFAGPHVTQDLYRTSPAE